MKIAVLGSLLYDCVIWGPRFPEVGETILGERNGFFTGGKGANQAVQCAKLGARVHMIGCVGRDSIGNILLDAMKQYHVDPSYISVLDDVATGSDCIHVDTATGNNKIMMAPLANHHMKQADVERALPAIREADVFLTQLETNLDMAMYGLRLARENGVTTILNPAPATEVPEGMFAYADYVTPNETEAFKFTGVFPEADRPETCAEAAGRLKELGAGNVIITLGKAGAYYEIGDRSGFAEPFRITAVDATAAGDAFNGAFAVFLAEGSEPADALPYACAAGALAATRPGAQPSMGTREEVLELIRAQR